MHQPEYNERQDLVNYLLRNYSSHLTRFEALAIKAVDLEREGSTDAWDQSSLMTLAEDSDPKVLEAVKTRDPHIREVLADRLLRDHADQIVVNRCPRCTKIVVSPGARQCLWCGHDWHGDA